MEQTIIRLAIGLVLLVAVNVVLGSLNALFDGTFDRIKCRNGSRPARGAWIEIWEDVNDALRQIVAPREGRVD